MDHSFNILSIIYQALTIVKRSSSIIYEISLSSSIFLGSFCSLNYKYVLRNMWLFWGISTVLSNISALSKHPTAMSCLSNFLPGEIILLIIFFLIVLS